MGSEREAETDYIVFTYRRNKEATDVSYEIQSSATLGDWLAVNAESSTVVDSDVDGDGRTELVKVRVSMTDLKLFLRLQVTK